MDDAQDTIPDGLLDNAYGISASRNNEIIVIVDMETSPKLRRLKVLDGGEYEVSHIQAVFVCDRYLTTVCLSVCH